MNVIKKMNNRRTTYWMPLGSSLGQRHGYLDITSVLHEANRADASAGYEYDSGPMYAIEVLRARDYAEYVGQYATAENYYKFSTATYTVCLTAEAD